MELVSGDINVWVEVAGKKAEEYNTQRSEDRPNISCFIEVEAGQHFRVRYDKLPLIPKHQTRINLSLDGKDITGRFFCKRRSEKKDLKKGKFDGYWEVNKQGQSVKRAFAFGKIQTTDKGWAHDLPKHLKEECCTIRVDIKTYLKKRYRHYNLKPAKPKKGEAKRAEKRYTTPFVNEDTKPAKALLLNRPGKVLGTYNFSSGGGDTCYCNESNEPETHQSIIFQYRTSQMLIGLGYKEDPNDTDKVHSKNRVGEEEGVMNKEASCESSNGVRVDGVEDVTNQNEAQSTIDDNFLTRIRQASSESIESTSRSKRVEVNNGDKIDKPAESGKAIVNLAPLRFIEVDIVEKDEDDGSVITTKGQS